MFWEMYIRVLYRLNSTRNRTMIFCGSYNFLGKNFTTLTEFLKSIFFAGCPSNSTTFCEEECGLGRYNKSTAPCCRNNCLMTSPVSGICLGLFCRKTFCPDSEGAFTDQQQTTNFHRILFVLFFCLAITRKLSTLTFAMLSLVT